MLKLQTEKHIILCNFNSLSHISVLLLTKVLIFMGTVIGREQKQGQLVFEDVMRLFVNQQGFEWMSQSCYISIIWKETESRKHQ